MGAGHIRSGRVTVRIAEPIPTAALKIGARAELTARVHDEIARMLKGSAEPVIHSSS
jgi:hypothetical protein